MVSAAVKTLEKTRSAAVLRVLRLCCAAAAGNPLPVRAHVCLLSLSSRTSRLAMLALCSAVARRAKGQDDVEL